MNEQNFKKTAENLVVADESYKNYTLLETPTKFSELANNKNFTVVDVHCLTSIYPDEIVGFVGDFSWINNILTPYDGDSYNKDMVVYAYHEFINTHNETCIGILVGDDW